jgi:hypothetical protein
MLSSFYLDDGKEKKEKIDFAKHMPSGGFEPPSPPIIFFIPKIIFGVATMAHNGLFSSSWDCPRPKL